jgi:signal transduction histidine kinase
VCPFFTNYLAAINIAILFLSVSANCYALYLIKRKEREVIRLEREKERIVNEARAIADSSDGVRRSIIANMTHEFRTPLNSVIGFAELLAEGETDQERIEMARCVQRGGWELLALVNSLVKAAELSNSIPKNAEPARFTLKELTAAVGAAHEQEAKSKGIRFVASCADAGRLVGDMDSIVAILGILVSNAVKYSESGTIELKARALSVTDGDSATIEFVVSDQGKGMERDKLERLFRPFEQGEDPLTKRYSGAGVGLYTAKRLTDALRGDLRLESERGVGTTAYLIIPLENDKGRGE